MGKWVEESNGSRGRAFWLISFLKLQTIGHPSIVAQKIHKTDEIGKTVYLWVSHLLSL